MMRVSLLALLLLLPAAGCSVTGPRSAPAPNAESSSADADSVWFARSDSWGRQCEPAPARPQTDPRMALSAEGIEVHDFVLESLPVCTACDICPASATRAFVQVFASDADRLRALGYEQSEPPAR